MTREQFTAKFPHASADTIRKNFPHDVSVFTTSVEEAKTDMPKKRLRQKSGPKLNKTEAAFFAYLNVTMLEHHHHAQAITFQIANGCRYTPDVVSFSKLTGLMTAHEIKGFMRDDAAVKLKVAASTYPHIRWRLVTKTKFGGWSIEEVFP